MKPNFGGLLYTLLLTYQCSTPLWSIQSPKLVIGNDIGCPGFTVSAGFCLFVLLFLLKLFFLFLSSSPVPQWYLTSFST